MKNYTIIILLIINLFCCQNTHDKQKPLEVKAEKKRIEKTSKIHPIKNTEKPLDTIKVLKEKFSINYDIKTKQYKSDIIELNEFKFIVYGGFYNLDLNDHYLTTYIDSIELIEPKKSILKSYGISDYLYKEKQYNFNNIIRLNDTNHDGRTDIEIYNSLKSGKGSNSTYDVFLNRLTGFEYSPEFSLANLKYDAKTNTYTSRGSGGHAGKIYGITTYKYDGKSLIPIKIETQDYDYEKKVYIRTTKDLKSNKTNIEEIKYR